MWNLECKKEPKGRNELHSLPQVLHPASPSTQVPPLQRSTVRKILPGLVEECYATDNAHRGVCVILEHDTYLPDMNLSPRKGSEVVM